MAKPLTYNATVVERLDLTSSLSVFKIRPDEAIDQQPRFIPGQYMVLGLNNEQKPELGSVRRPMSIASAPEETAAFEFYIRYVSHPESENPLTHLLWRIRTGDRIYLGPRITGNFTLPDTIGADDPRLKVLVAAGTGLAPFLSMVRHVVLTGSEPNLSRYLILHGASYPADLGYRDELEQLVAQHGLHYRCSVSRPKEAPDWQGDSGRVEDYFLPDHLTALERDLGLEPGGFNPRQVAVFICGLQGTIGSTVTRLLPRGFVPENRRLEKALEVPEGAAASLFFEQYDTTPVVDLKDEALMADLRAQLHGALARLAS